MKTKNRRVPFLAQGQTLVAVRKDGSVWASTARGIRPLLDALEKGVDLKGARCCDKIVGRAAAFLFVRAGVAEVRAPVMAIGATRIFDQYGIGWNAETTVEKIRNRANTGPCPMEQAVAEIGDDQPEGAEKVLRETLARLLKMKSEQA